MTEQQSLQQQIDELKEIVSRLQSGESKYVPPGTVARNIKREALEKYYGTWSQFRDSEISCTPSGKKWNDREFLQTGCSKLTDIIYKHGNDITASCNITGELRTQEDIDEYKEIAEYVVSCVHDKVRELRLKKGHPA